MQHAVITGANRGIGLELCRQLAGSGWSVTALCRRATPELRALPLQISEDFDVTDETALHDFAEGLAPASVDLLINNAGILDSTPWTISIPTPSAGNSRSTHSALYG